MVRNILLSSFATTMLLAAWSPEHLMAQEIADFNGSWALVEEASDDVEEAIDVATADRNFLMRGIMRGRLKDALAPAMRITLTTTPEGELEIGGAPGDALRTPLDGGPVSWTHPNGEVLEVRAEFADGEIRQRFDAKGAVREHVYHLRSSDSTLELHVTVTSDRLSRPLSYTLVYAREMRTKSET